MENHNKETENDKRSGIITPYNKHKEYNKHKKSLFYSRESLLERAERREREMFFSAIVCFVCCILFCITVFFMAICTMKGCN